MASASSTFFRTPGALRFAKDLGGRAAQAAAAEDAARAGGAGSVSQWALGDYPPTGPARVAVGRHRGLDALVV